MAQSLPQGESRHDVGMPQLSRRATPDLPAVNIPNIVDIDTGTTQCATSRQDCQQIPVVCRNITEVTLRPTPPTPQIRPRVAYDDMDIEALNRREGRNDHFMVSLEQFLQSTTFHGIRYIFEKTEFSLRRLVYFSFNGHIQKPRTA